jgi:predicted nucleic acid-binding protein
VTLYVDTSALVALHVECAPRAMVVEAIRDHESQHVCTSAVSLTESLALIPKLTEEPVYRTDLEDSIRLTWDHLTIVPIDQRCLDRAAALMCEQPLRLADALHLAAADRLPRPVTYLTLDPSQIPVALSLGFDVVSA